jgi:hypothetical protein
VVGEEIWIAGPAHDADHNIALDSTGNVYVSGAYSETVEFDPGNSTGDRTSEGLTDIFVIKYDGNGNFIWVQSIGGISSDGGYGITTDANGNVYVTGIYNLGLDTQLRFANTTNAPATVHIFIGGNEMTGSPFTLEAGESTPRSFPTIDSGPVQIVSDVPIVAAERVIYRVNGTPTSFSEMMALPDSLLDSTFWLPWYNNVHPDTQLRFGIP